MGVIGRENFQYNRLSFVRYLVAALLLADCDEEHAQLMQRFGDERAFLFGQIAFGLRLHDVDQIDEVAGIIEIHR